METLSNKKSQKSQEKLYCELCDYTCSNKKDYVKHLLTLKHKKHEQINVLETNSTDFVPFVPKNIYKCEKCEKIYKERSGLWKHKKKCCTEKNTEEIVIDPGKNKNEQVEMICKLIQQNMELITQNKEFKDLIVEQTKTITELANKPNIINNN